MGCSRRARRRATRCSRSAGTGRRLQISYGVMVYSLCVRRPGGRMTDRLAARLFGQDGLPGHWAQRTHGHGLMCLARVSVIGSRSRSAWTMRRACPSSPRVARLSVLPSPMVMRVPSGRLQLDISPRSSSLRQLRRNSASSLTMRGRLPLVSVVRAGARSPSVRLPRRQWSPRRGPYSPSTHHCQDVGTVPRADRALIDGVAQGVRSGQADDAPACRRVPWPGRG